ncbi:MAG TPA: AAA family ATPase [Acidimicrobiia bacterium]|nr:AAA family ATPase [Acidimicrobiia bacterium]
MTTHEQANQLSVIQAIWRWRLPVLGVTVLFGIVGFLANAAQEDEFVASSSLVLEDPAASSVLADAVVRTNPRFITNQLEILRSAVVAQRASEKATAAGRAVGISDVISRSQFTPLTTADVIIVTVRHENRELAGLINEYLVDAYVEVQREQRRDAAESVLQQLSAAEEVLASALAEVNGELAAISDRRGIDGQTEAVLDELAATQALLLATADPERRSELLARMVELDQQLRTLRLASDIEATHPDVEGLLRSRDQLLTRISDIARRQTEVEIDSGSQASVLVFASPPTVVAAGSRLAEALRVVAGLLVGFVLASSLAYVYTVLRRTFGNARQPESDLGLSYLGEVPEFDVRAAPIPVRDDPRGLAAEAFRFVAAAVQLRAERREATSVMFVSAHVGDGKSTVVANTAMAAARSGRNILVVDADFGNQATSQLLMGDVPLQAGLTELVAGQMLLDDAVAEVEVSSGVSFDLLSRGMLPVVAPDFFSSQQVRSVLSQLETVYDLILVDGPPLMQVAYASNLVQMTGSTVVVLSHDSTVRAAEELTGRLAFLEAAILGYVYNRAPRRAGIDETGGSMKDILGDRGFVDKATKRSAR